LDQVHYEALGAKLAGGEPPVGILYHACGPKDDSWLIAEIWESREAFDRWVDERLLPAMRAVGGPGPSRREVLTTYHAGPVQRST
jgi:hypothetical protein